VLVRKEVCAALYQLSKGQDTEVVEAFEVTVPLLSLIPCQVAPKLRTRFPYTDGQFLISSGQQIALGHTPGFVYPNRRVPSKEGVTAMFHARRRSRNQV